MAKGIDIDEIIRDKHGDHQSIIDGKGIKYFRELEVSTISEQLNKKLPCVIALGGGAFLDERTRNNINTTDALTIFIDRPFDVMWEETHISGYERETGPMTKSYNDVYAIYQDRLPIYLQADLIIKSYSDESVEETFDNLINLLKGAGDCRSRKS